MRKGGKDEGVRMNEGEGKWERRWEGETETPYSPSNPLNPPPSINPIPLPVSLPLVAAV